MKFISLCVKKEFVAQFSLFQIYFGIQITVTKKSVADIFETILIYKIIRIWIIVNIKQ